MKKIIYASILTVVLLLSGCSTSNSKDVKPQTDETTEPRTLYMSKCNSEYWNLLKKDTYSKKYYEYALNFSDSINKNVYLFYGDKADSYTEEALKGIEFARLDHPEQKLMDDSKNFEEYSRLINEVNSEVKDLINKVNNVDDIIEKHRLIFEWLKINVNYLEKDSDEKEIELDEVFKLVEFSNKHYYKVSSTLYDAIVKKEATSEGIADAYKYICNCCNLESTIVKGNIIQHRIDFYAKYHSWNLVKVHDEWYLVDLNWNIRNHINRSLFMVTDLYWEDHIPLNIGYDLPWYSKKEFDTITFKNSGEKNVILSNEGIKFSQEDDDYVIHPVSDSRRDLGFDIEISPVYEGGDNLKKLDRDICLRTNAKIKEERYYTFDDLLITINKKDLNDIVIPYKIHDYPVGYVQVILQYNNHEYRTTIIRR